VLQRWPAAGVALLEGRPGALDALPIDHAVAPVAQAGGEAAALGRLRAWLRDGLARYVDERNQPLSGATSELSPYLHFGHVSAWEVFSAVAKAEGWTLDRLSPRADGRRSGWWGMGASAEAFVDQLVTWRELGFNFCAFRDDAAELDSLPDFARETLARHAGDAREHVYRLPAFERAETHDEIWNAAQRELLREGRIHNYLRMLWGKKILEWTRSPREALSVLLTLNDRFALDGRDPNSLSGIFWCLGRYDRGWGPEREVFGTVRYMSSANTARKVRLGAYLARYAP
jgi:deoxyribodipyrimidine photo-lyase